MEVSAAALEALRQAMDLEQRGNQFYLEAAKRTKDPRGKEMFRSLARDEVMHLNTVQRQYEALSRGEDWLPLTGAPERPVDLEKPLLPPDRETLDRTIRAEASDIDALHFALQFENDAYDLYRKAAAETADPVGRKMYEWLNDAELTHFSLLMLNYEYLTRVGHWLVLQEAE